MNIGNWIPQVFYDLIGRIIPGAILLIMAFFLFQPLSQALTTLDKLFTRTGVSTTIIILVAIAISYVVGALLGGLGYGIAGISSRKFKVYVSLFRKLGAFMCKLFSKRDSSDKNEGQASEEKSPKKVEKEEGSRDSSDKNEEQTPEEKSPKEETEKEETSRNSSDKNEKQIPKEKSPEKERKKESSKSFTSHEPYKHDFIQFHCPRVGARLAKLSAEKHMARVLMVGTAILMVVYAITSPLRYTDSRFWGIGIGLVVTYIASFSFHKYIGSRSQKLIRNNCHLIQEALKSDTAPNKTVQTILEEGTFK